MQIFPDIKHYMKSLSQYFHIYLSSNTVVKKKDKYNKQLKPNCINLFLWLKLQTKPCHIIDLLHREFHKDSKKSTFAILRFFYEFLCISKFHPWNLQKQKKRKQILHREP